MQALNLGYHKHIQLSRGSGTVYNMRFKERKADSGDGKGSVHLNVWVQLSKGCVPQVITERHQAIVLPVQNPSRNRNRNLLVALWLLRGRNGGLKACCSVEVPVYEDTRLVCVGVATNGPPQHLGTE